MLVLANYLEEVFSGDQIETVRWLRRPNEQVGFLTPLEVALSGQSRRRRLLEMLGREDRQVWT